MSSLEQALVSYLAEIKPRKIGFIDLRTNVDGWCADISLDARYDLFTSECIFDDCTDAQAETFLAAFLAHGFAVSWSVSEQLSKLLCVRGRLVSENIEPLLRTLDWRSCATHQLFLSYLAVRADGAALAAQLLEQVPEDARDGLFLACHRLKSEELDRKLIAKFAEWGAGRWDPVATGELYALEQFIAKWLGLYPYRDLEGVIRLYFKYRAEH
jgi:hypothetical protein